MVAWVFGTIFFGYGFLLGWYLLYKCYKRRRNFVWAWSELRDTDRPDELIDYNNPRPRPLVLLVGGIFLILGGGHMLYLGFSGQRGQQVLSYLGF